MGSVSAAELTAQLTTLLPKWATFEFRVLPCVPGRYVVEVLAAIGEDTSEFVADALATEGVCSAPVTEVPLTDELLGKRVANARFWALGYIPDGSRFDGEGVNKTGRAFITVATEADAALLSGTPDKPSYVDVRVGPLARPD